MWALPEGAILGAFLAADWIWFNQHSGPAVLLLKLVCVGLIDSVIGA
jgi:hypothetical protein